VLQRGAPLASGVIVAVVCRGIRFKTRHEFGLEMLQTKVPVLIAWIAGDDETGSNPANLRRFACLNERIVRSLAHADRDAGSEPRRTVSRPASAGSVHARGSLCAACRSGVGDVGCGPPTRALVCRWSEARARQTEAACSPGENLVVHPERQAMGASSTITIFPTRGDQPLGWNLRVATPSIASRMPEACQERGRWPTTSSNVGGWHHIKRFAVGRVVLTAGNARGKKLDPAITVRKYAGHRAVAA